MNVPLPTIAPDPSRDALGTRDGEAPFHKVLRLRRDTAMPLYKQLDEQISALISSNKLAPGATLPAERQLAEELGISRATVQQCYASLRERGLIAGHGRHGSIVQGEGIKILPGMDQLRGFTQEMLQLGRQPSARVLEHKITTDRSIASLFGLHSSARFLRLVRVRLGDEIPLSRESAWYSLEAAPCLSDISPEKSVYGQLAENGLSLSHCDQTIEATSPSEEECEVFGYGRPLPCLLIKRRTFLRAGPMVEYVEGTFRGDAYSYQLRLEA